MFSKKYLFETKKTKSRRYFYNIMAAFMLLFVMSIVLCLSFIRSAKIETNKTKEIFYKKSPDLLAIFTGDTGRISFGLEKALEFKALKILISGVYTANNIKSILSRQNDDLLEKLDLDSNLIEIDYLARNTVENVLTTLRFLRKEKGYQKILIVSHDYHIMRIKLLVDKLQDKNIPYEFYYMGVETNYTQWRNIKILYKEVFKFLKSIGFLFLWELEGPSTFPKEILGLNRGTLY